MIDFNATKKDMLLIHKIAERAVQIAKSESVNYTLMDAEMDLTACHLNGCPLKLEKLLDSERFDFIHDVFGIRRNINRKTGKLENFFLPRLSK